MDTNGAVGASDVLKGGMCCICWHVLLFLVVHDAFGFIWGLWRHPLTRDNTTLGKRPKIE